MLSGVYHFYLLEEELVLLPQKAIWFPKYQTLLVSDTHLGKGAHFRKAGIAIPQILAQEELALLSDLISELNPQKLIFLGDLFHSEMNNDCDWFVLWRELHQKIEMILVKGNHDILPEIFYQKVRLKVADSFFVGKFKLMHEPPKLQEANYIIAGHIHPGVRLKGKARQGVTLPCFYFGVEFAVLPAFGKFTGKALMKIQTNAQIFAVVGEQVIAI
ncbi:MAG: ligase-associated DNA damage response endonuclease PdeM [Sphingobacteriales bacterium]|nr:ligase-associated DNA damage response endonuclease PdeM [Sphingobacteriales bacterium]